MSSVATEFLIILLLLFANGVFALSEIAIVSARKARLQQRAEMGDARARAALELANSPSHFLSTVQIGITLVGIFTGAFGGATLTEKLSASLNDIPRLAPYSRALSLGIVVLGITYLSLIIGELVPKRIGLNNPEKIAALVAVPMRTLSVIASPLVRFLSFSTDLVVRLLGMRPSSEPPVTEEEIHVLIQQGAAAGVFEEAEQEMVEKVFRLGDRRASTLMTPRPEVVFLDVEDTQEEIRRKVIESGHSAFPLCRENMDTILGFVRARDLVSQCFIGQAVDLERLARPPLLVPENIRLLRLLEVFKQSHQHMAVLIDEYGGTQGLVTATDILEAIVGELPASEAPEEQDFIRREDGSWLVDGMASMEDLMDRFDLREMPVELGEGYDTLGGFIMTSLRRIPVTGDCVEWSGLRFEVMDMDDKRVDKVLIAPLREREQEL